MILLLMLFSFFLSFRFFSFARRVWNGIHVWMGKSLSCLVLVCSVHQRMPSWVPEEKIREALEKAEAEDSTGYIYDVFQKLKKAKEQNRGLRKYVTPKKKNKKRRR